MERVSLGLLLAFAASLRAVEAIPMMRTGRMASNLTCTIGSHWDESERVTVDFDFFYAIGTTSDVRMFDLEQLLYTSIDQSLLWCFEIKQSKNDPTRRLGIVTFTPGTIDSFMETPCPQSLEGLVLSTGAIDCRVVRGAMRILAHPVDDVSYAIAGIRHGLKTAMDDGLGQNSEIDGLAFTSYLADTEPDLFLEESGDDLPVGIDAVGDAMTGETSDRSWGLFLGLGIPMVMFVLLAAYLAKRRSSIASSEVGHVELDEMKDSMFFLAGTGDHPNSFHEGLYHYTESGQQYLSTQCEDCINTRRDYFYAQDCAQRFAKARIGMGTIPEDAPYMSCRSGDESSGVSGSFIKGQPTESDVLQHLGGHGHNHKCNSSTCTRCHPAEGNAHQTVFLGLSGSLSNDSFDLFTDDEVVEAYLELVPDQAEV